MSIAGGVDARSLAALGDDASIAMGWLEMVISQGSHSQTYALRVIEKPANEFVRMITDPLNLISVVGPARSGKSTLMNLLAGCKTTELFATYAGMETWTKGVYVPTRVLTLPQFSALEGEPVVEAANSAIKVSFVDTEGQGAVGDVYDMNLFSPALIISRVVIYNRTGGLLTEEILSQLGMMTQAAKRLQAETSRPSSTPQGPIFGHLFIIFNQYRLNPYDNESSLKTKLMTEEPETDSNSKIRNDIRKMLKSVFESIQVFILPDKLKSDARDELSEGTKKFLLLDDFEPKYLQYFKILRNALSRALVTSRQLVAGNPLTGGSIADFMPSFADAINKSEPLNLPSIFEAAQNNAISKALAVFTNTLGLSVQSRLKDDAKPTSFLSRLFDGDLNIALAQLSSTISYMPLSVINAAKDSAIAASEGFRKTLLETNLDRLKALMASALTALVALVPIEVQRLFPDKQKLLVSPVEVNNQFTALRDTLESTYRTKGETYDPSSFPAGYQKVIQDAVDSQKITLSGNVTTAWSIWAADINKELLDAMMGKLATVASETQVGDSRVYASKAVVITNTTKGDFSRKLDAEYLWTDKEDQKTSFAGKVDSIAAVQRALWEENEVEVKKQLMDELQRIKDIYNMRLQNALPSQEEPETYNEIVDDTEVRVLLETFCTRNRISSTLSQEALHQLRVYVSSRKSEFSSTYNQASDYYANHLRAQLETQLPLILNAYIRKLDEIDLNLSRDIKKGAIETSCNAAETQAEMQLQLAISRLRVRQNGTVSTAIIQLFKDRLQHETDVGKAAKLSKYDEVVSVYNKALLTSIVIPIVDTALDNKYSSVPALEEDVKKAWDTFNSKKRGDGPDAVTKWRTFKETTYLALLETVRRFNAYVVPGLDNNLAATKEIQEKVASTIVGPCVTLANLLGMSWIGSGFGDSRPQDMGMSIKDPLKPGQQNSRTLRMNNQSTVTDGYKTEFKTNIEFFDWTVEISDIIWGKPIITDLKPVKIDTTEFGAQSTPLNVTVGAISTETTTITDSQTWGVNAGVEVGYRYGVKDTWEASVKATFNGKFDSTHSNQVTSTYTTSTSAQLVLPPNRVNLVNQMIFNQRTSLPYTAKVKVIPRLRFQNGFTRWGGGDNYHSNPNTNARKVGFGAGTRVYGDQEFKRCDEIRDDARANSDPWEWTLCMQRNPGLVNILDTLASSENYEVYVKGKWEGITGKYAVTTVTPKDTALTLLPIGL